MKKQFKGKAIYNPSGKAGEYSYWACNFYVGCSNGCTYCYCKKGILAKAQGMDMPQLKKCFKNEFHADEIFEKELLINKDELQKHGLFFSFTTDPFLEETEMLTLRSMNLCAVHGIPVKILTKCTYWVDEYITIRNPKGFSKEAYGFTLTGHDELEPGASTNAERIEAMRKLHDAGFKTFASIEPIIDLHSSFKMIQDTNGFCDLYKIGLMSGKKYDIKQLIQFINAVVNQVAWYGAKIYFKDSLLKTAGIDRLELPSNCVTRDYNMFQEGAQNE